MSAENKLKTAAGLSCAWDGETIRRVRAGDGVTILAGRRVSLHLMVQPGVAAIMLSDDDLADQGVLSRCLVIAPESHAGRRFYREQATYTKNKLMEYERRLQDILQRKFPLAANTRNVLAPRILRLDAGATKIWRTFADHVEGQIGRGGVLEHKVGTREGEAHPISPAASRDGATVVYPLSTALYQISKCGVL